MFKEYLGFEIKIEAEIKRKVEIMQLISMENRWYTFEEIAKVTKISTKTVSKDLASIREIVPANWGIEIKRGYGVKLLMPIDTSIKEILSFFFRKSLTFQVLNELLHHKDITIFEIAENLYIQPYKVTKVLNKIEKDLAYYGLKLKRKPLRILGGECEIIYMFSDLYSKAFLCSEWPFEHNQEHIVHFIEELEDEMGLLPCLSRRRKFSIFIAILLLRKQQEHEMELTHDFLYFNIGTPAFNTLSIVAEHLNEFFDISLSTSEKIILTTLFKTLNYEFKSPDYEKERDLQEFNTSKIPVYNLLKSFLEKLDEKLGYDFINDKEFVYWLLVYFREKIYILHLLSYMKRIEEPSIQYMKKKYSKTFLLVKDVYNKWVREHNIACFVTDEEIMKIVIQIEANQICKNVNSKKAMIITHEDGCWKSYIEAVLKSKFGNKIEFASVTSTNIARGQELEEEYEIDFIISTISLKLDSNPVVQIQPVVTERDLSNIEYFLNRDIPSLKRKAN